MSPVLLRQRLQARPHQFDDVEATPRRHRECIDLKPETIAPRGLVLVGKAEVGKGVEQSMGRRLSKPESDCDIGEARAARARLREHAENARPRARGSARCPDVRGLPIPIPLDRFLLVRYE